MTTAPVGVTKPARRCNHDQTSDDARAETEHRGFAARDPLDAGPGGAGDRRSESGRGEGVGSHPVGARSAARVETVPADPEHSGADHRQHQAVGREVGVTETLAFADDQREDERRPSARHVHHGAAGKVDGLDLGAGIPDAVHEAVDTPDHVGEREVHQKHPAEHEQHQGAELHPFGDRADDQSRRDDREHQLEHREDVLRNPGRVVGVRHRIDAREHRELGPAEEGITRSESEAVADCPPEDRHHAGHPQALRHHAQHVFAADQTAVEKCEARQRHEQHQRRGCHHPAVVTRTRTRHLRRSRVHASAVVHVRLRDRQFAFPDRLVSQPERRPPWAPEVRVVAAAAGSAAAGSCASAGRRRRTAPAGSSLPRPGPAPPASRQSGVSLGGERKSGKTTVSSAEGFAWPLPLPRSTFPTDCGDRF